MRLHLTGDMLTSTVFDPRMVLQNPNTISARSHLAQTQTTSNCNNYTDNNMAHQRPVIDLLVAMVAVPLMILCALQLEKNLQDMASSPESRWVVFGLGIGMLFISIIICGYITHRMGVCIWTGPIDELGNRTDGYGVAHINSQNDILRIVDSMPPSYDSVVKFDIPPPPYDCLVIDIEDCKEEGESVIAATNAAVSLNHNSNNNNLSQTPIYAVVATPTATMNLTTSQSNSNNLRPQFDKLLPIEASAMHI